MALKTRWWIARIIGLVAVAVVVLFALPALARVGGGEHYTGGNSNSSDNDSDGDAAIAWFLIRLCFEYPQIGVPLLICFGIYAYFKYMRTEGDKSTQKAFQQRESAARTTVTASSVQGWVNAIKFKDPQFDLLKLFDQTKTMFTLVQSSWFKRNLEPVRRFLSDATFQRLGTQLKLLDSQGIRDAIADVQVKDLQLIGLRQDDSFDTVHIRVTASMRDADAASTVSDDEAIALARRQQPTTFTEVWTLVRKPGATSAGADHSAQGNCPNCGAPFTGGAANKCTHCQAIVNSGNYDWVLAEITQGFEFNANESGIGLAKLRETDAGLNTQILEDRASLCFWKWIDAQSSGEPARMTKLAGPGFQAQLTAELTGGRRKQVLECAIGAVNTIDLERSGGVDRINLEVRWSAKFSKGAPNVPQRWVFTLERKTGATTNAALGMSTNRCGNCGAPLSDNGAPSCEYCGNILNSGDKDWVLANAVMWEQWRTSTPRPAAAAATPPNDRVIDRQERERLLYMMAALAASDGAVDERERAQLKMCSERWGVSYANVEMALSAGPVLFDRLVARATPEAEMFLQQLVDLALIDGKIDRKERAMLETAAGHLGLQAKLPQMLG